MTATTANYEHTQHGRLHYIFFTVAAVMLGGAWLARSQPLVAALNLGVAALLVIVALVFGSLTVRDAGEWLCLRYGPLPILRKRIRYADITAVALDRSAIIDGWGIHYVPGRGWTYNLWGFRCVKLTLGKKTVRVGTDDAANLAEFLKAKVLVKP
jgi:hypothetical protein